MSVQEVEPISLRVQPTHPRSGSKFNLMALFNNVHKKVGKSDDEKKESPKPMLMKSPDAPSEDDSHRVDFIYTPSDEGIDSPKEIFVKHCSSFSVPSTAQSSPKLINTGKTPRDPNNIKRHGSLESNIVNSQNSSPRSPLSQSFSRFFPSGSPSIESLSNSPSKSNLLEYQSKRKHATVYDPSEIKKILNGE